MNFRNIFIKSFIQIDVEIMDLSISPNAVPSSTEVDLKLEHSFMLDFYSFFFTITLAVRVGAKLL